MATRNSASKTTTKRPAAKPEKPTASAAIQVATLTTKPRPARKPSAPKPVEPIAPAAPEVPTGAERYRWIAHAAYLKAERRGFVPANEIEDWLEAESEFLAAFGLKSG